LTFSNAKLLCFLYPQCPAHLSFSDLIIQYYTNSTICKVYHYVIFFILLLSMNKYSCKELGDTIARLVKWPTVTE
jgi:amino acid permease